MKNRTCHSALRVSLALALVGFATAAAASSFFMYQGRLTIGGGSPDPSERFDMQFRLFDVPVSGLQLTGSVTQFSVPCPEGLFSVPLDFGSNIFNGDPRWLQIEVRPATNNPSAPYAVLSPRQQITPAPYALHAQKSELVSDGSVRFEQLAPDAVGNINLQTGAVTGAKIADGNVVRSLNGLKDSVSLSADAGIMLTTIGNDLRIAALRSCTDYTNCYWNLRGNGNISGGNFLGTVAGELEPLEIRVNDNRALQVIPATTPNLVGGYAGNHIDVAVVGAHIGGGGEGGSVNSIAGNYDTIGGGSGHTIEKPSNYATIAGGNKNTIHTNSSYSSIAGGDRNDIGVATPYGTIGGGVLNNLVTGARWSTIAGGNANSVGASVSYGFIGGGTNNIIQSDASGAAIVGGALNTVQVNSDNASVGGGLRNVVYGNAPFATIPGGQSAGAVNYGQIAYASGGFTAAGNGEAQLGFYVLRRSMTSGATNELFLDGDAISRRMVVRAEATWAFEVLVAARADPGASAGFRIAGVIRRPAVGAISFVGVPTTVTLADDIGGAIAVVEADAANNALVIKGKAEGGVPTRWVATVRTSEVIY